MTKLFIDFETRSLKELRGPNSVGLSNYCEDPSTEAIILAYAFDEEEPRVWFPLWEPIPQDLRESITWPANCDIRLVAYNSAFERNILKHVLGIDVPVCYFDDPQPSARYLSLPGSLDEVGEILNLPEELKKTKDGKRLIDVFTKPTKKKGQEPYFRDWDSDPEDWQRFVEYAKQDIRAEREILKRLQSVGCFPLPEKEREIWELDQQINLRGIPVDVEFVTKAYKLAVRSKEEALQEQNRITGLNNANSTQQLLPWVRERGYPFNTLRKSTIDVVLKDSKIELTTDCRTVLKDRREASSTSYKKLATILRQVSADSRLRNQFIYLGSSRCGRWSGNSVQMQNLARPDQLFEDFDNLNLAREMIYKEDYDGIKQKFGSVLLTIKNTIRTVFSGG